MTCHRFSFDSQAFGVFGYFASEHKAAPSRSTPKAPLVGVGNYGTVADESERAELDGIVAHLYGLTEEEFV